MLISDFFFWQKPKRKIKKLANNFLESEFEKFVIHTEKHNGSPNGFLLCRSDGKVKIIMGEGKWIILRTIIYDKKLFDQITSDLEILFGIKNPKFFHRWVMKKYNLRCNEFKFYHFFNIPWFLDWNND